METGFLFLTQMGIGILGNSYLLCLYNFNLITGHMLRPTDKILNQMVLANSLVLLSKGIPQTMSAFGLKFFLDDAGCKFVFYFHRVGRGVSLSTTCFLSGFQAIKLCPNVSRWMELRMRNPKCIGLCCSFFWGLHLLLNSLLPFIVNGPRNSTNTVVVRVKFRYCSIFVLEKLINDLYAFIFPFIDLIHLGFMVWASGFMVLTLYRHKRRVQHIRSNSLHPKAFREAKAICTILVLVSMFVSFHAVSTVLAFCFTLTVIPNQWLVDFSVFMASCFPTFSPLVLIFSDTRIFPLFWVCFSRISVFSNPSMEL